MLLVLLVVFVGIIFLLCYLYEKYDYDDCLQTFLVSVNIGLAIICFIAAAVFLISVGGKDRVLDAQIAMYEEENLKIESTIDAVVKDYLGYEQDAYKGMKPSEDAIASAIAYPELASRELIAKQLEVYIANNEKIKELKTDKIKLSREKWWLYFGN